VAKRVRGSRSAHRPGGQGPLRTRKTAEASSPSGADVAASAWDADVDEAIDLVMMDTMEVSIEEPAPVVQPTRRQRRATRVKADSLQARVAAENVYVLEDLRRIGVVSAVLFVGLLLAWILFVPLDLLGLY
jgi:hypothetical protein